MAYRGRSPRVSGSRRHGEYHRPAGKSRRGMRKGHFGPIHASCSRGSEGVGPNVAFHYTGAWMGCGLHSLSGTLADHDQARLSFLPVTVRG